MHGLGRERWQTDGDLLRAFGMRRAVLHPFTRVGDNSLCGLHVEHTRFVRHAERALENNGEFVEFRCLARFYPAARTADVRDAKSRFTGVHTSDEFLDDFRFVACRRDARGSRDYRGMAIRRYGIENSIASVNGASSRSYS